MIDTFEGLIQVWMPAGEQASGIITKAGDRDPRDHLGLTGHSKGFNFSPHQERKLLKQGITHSDLHFTELAYFAQKRKKGPGD